MATEVNRKTSNQQELFGPLVDTGRDMSVSNDAMAALMKKYGLLPTNAFQNFIAEMLLQRKEGKSISRLYAEKVHVEASIAEKLLRASEQILNGTGEALRGCVDLVFWGSSCDVGLVAFYENAVKTFDPAMWTYPSRLTFVCDSDSEWERCRWLAEILFPNAEKFAGVVCELSDGEKIKSTLPRRQFVIPRVHIVTSDNATPAYFGVLKDALTGEQKNVLLDYFAFVGWSREFVCENLAAAFGEAFEHIEMADNEISFGKLVSNKLEERLRCYKQLRRIRELARSPQERKKNFEIEKLIRHLAYKDKELIPGRRFLDVYESVQWLTFDKLSIDCLVFYPKPGTLLKVFILKLTPFETKKKNGKTYDDEMVIAEKWIRLCSSKTENSEIDEVVRNYDSVRQAPKGSVESSRGWCEAWNKIREFVVVMSWNFKKDEIGKSQWNSDHPQSLTWNRNEDIDLVDMFGVAFKGVRPLSQPDADQEKVVYDRHTYRKVRGGPGTGKTLTMLWHAAQVVENRHLPVVVLGKTNTLAGRNLRAFAATFCTRNNCSSEALRQQVEFSTVAMFVCGYARMIRGECLRDRCSGCCIKASYEASKKAREKMKESTSATPDQKSEKTFHFVKAIQDVMSACPDNASDYCICQQMLKDESRSIREAYRHKCCTACKKNFFRLLFTGEANLDSLKKDYRAYGGVMIDECQSISCEELQACYLITAVKNPLREFYMFCDEEQHFRGGTLERDGVSKKSVVRAPAKGFGHFVTLTKNHRAISKRLLSVYNAIQDKMARRYDVRSLLMVPPERMGRDADDVKAFAVKRGDAAIFASDDCGFGAILGLVSDMKKETEKDTLLVLCDDVSKLRIWSVRAKKQNWIVTHLPSTEESKVERRLRLRFGQRPGYVHLTGIDCAQGQTFENVLYISTQSQIRKAGGIEELFTALTRARAHLRVVDYSDTGWLYEMLRGFNDQGNV